MDLVAELSSNTKILNETLKVVPLIAKAAEYRHYTQHVHLLETVCKQVRDRSTCIRIQYMCREDRHIIYMLIYIKEYIKIKYLKVLLSEVRISNDDVRLSYFSRNLFSIDRKCVLLIGYNTRCL